jgi:glycosyltransferase involved in cell wall biosynthesis
LLKAQYPRRRIQVQPHGVSPVAFRERDCRSTAYEAYPQVVGREILLVVSRIDPVKNQGWLLDELPEIIREHPKALLVLAGACTDMAYGSQILQRIHKLGIQNQVVMTGGLSPGDPRLIGLLQAAAAVVLPSISETFGLVILEAWSAGAVPIASGTSGARALIRHRKNGWLFDLAQPRTYHEAVNEALCDRKMVARLAQAGLELVRSEYDTDVLAGRMATLYQQLREERNALRHSA